MFAPCLVLIILLGCDNTNHNKDIVSELTGKEIILPDSLEVGISGKRINLSLDEADYTIVTYIDSDGCTPCRMKLKPWNDIVNEFKSLDDTDVNFLMIVNAGRRSEAKNNIIKEKFMHPVCFDPYGIFAIRNKLPDDSSYHTFLLDDNGEIILVGNPATNPKILDLYRKMIYGDQSRSHIVAKSAPLGVISPGDTVVKSFEIRNTDSSTLSVQGIVPSCDCVSAYIDKDTIPGGKTAVITLKYIPDSVKGAVRRYVDVFYNEKDSPDRFSLHGYVDNGKNSSI